MATETLHERINQDSLLANIAGYSASIIYAILRAAHPDATDEQMAAWIDEALAFGTRHITKNKSSWEKRKAHDA